MPCQDRAVAVRDDDLVVLAVADGMGCEAYRHVELGAEFAVNFVREHAKKFISTLRIKEDENRSIVWEDEDEDRDFSENIRATMFDLRKGLINHARTLKIW
jgi:hypothetical protein